MEKKNLMTKIISGVLIGSVVLSMGITAFAFETSVEDTIKEDATKSESTMMGKFKGEMNFKKGHRKGQKDLKELLNALVEEGKITQDTVDKMNDFVEAKIEERKEMTREERSEKPAQKRDILVEMKEEGIITDEVIDAIRAKKEEMNEAKHNEMLSGLVEKGYITEEDKTEIADFMKAKMEERRLEFEKIKDMTEEERKAYFEENKKEKTNLMTELVEAGIITEEQAENIKENMPKPQGFKGGHQRKGHNGQRPEGKGPKGFNN